MRILTLTDVENAPRRSFSAGSALAQELNDWYAENDPASVAGFLLGEKDDAGRDGSDAQLRDAVCLLAGLKRNRVPVLNEDGTQAVSEKRGKLQWREEPFTSADRLQAMGILGIHERELSREGTTRMVAIVRSDGSDVPTQEWDESENVNEDEGSENEND